MSNKCYKLSPEEQESFNKLRTDVEKIVFLDTLMKSKETLLPKKVLSKQGELIDLPPEEPFDPDKRPRYDYSLVGEEETDPLLPKRRPMIIEWEDEQANAEKAMSNPTVSKSIHIPERISILRENAERLVNRLQDEYESILETEDKEGIKEIESRLKELAKGVGLSKKDLLGRRWDDLTPDERLRLAISLIPDKSLKFSSVREFFDMDYFMEFMEELTGAPFYPVLLRMEAANAAAETAKERILQRITLDPSFKDIRGDSVALERVALEINSRNEVQGIESPPDLTENEMMLADAIEDVYNSYKPIVRYLRVMRTETTIEDFKKEFPDAVEAGKEFELELAVKLKEEGSLDDLWAFLFKLDWGVIESGFDPRLIASPGLKIKRHGGLKTVRGKGRLLRRESIEYPAGKMSMNVLARLASYIEQMEIQWRIEPEINTLSNYWDIVGEKFENWGQIERGLETWLERVQNIGLGYNFFDRQVRKIWRQAMSAIFIDPGMALRNSFQAILLHPDRTELFTRTWRALPKDIGEKGNRYFETFVSQLGGLRRDWLHVGEKGFLVPEWWNRFADSLSLYGKSDYYPRLLSFKVALGKANRATQQFLKDGDVNKWTRNSGAIHLRVTERNYVLSHYLGQPGKSFNLDVPGLHDLSNNEMADIYIAHKVSDMTNFKYRRAQRGLIEQGVTGTTLWNLIVFPRGYAQRLYFQAEKIKNVFSGTASWEEARSGFGDIMKIVVVSLLFDELWKDISGRRHNPYFVMNILFGWQFGGLFVGIGQDMTKAMTDMMIVINPTEEKKSKDEALSRLPQAIERLGDTLIPFYRRGWDIAESILDRDHLDRGLLRQARGLLEKDYTPEELDEIDRGLWEKIRKAAIGGEVQDPTALQASMVKVEEAETRIGTMDMTGKFYTVGDFGRETSSLIKTIPNILITEQEGFSPLTLFYKESEIQWEELYKLPANKREKWRKEHPHEEALLLFWEKYSESVFTKDSQEAREIKGLLRVWFDVYGIGRNKHSEWANWGLPITIPVE